MIGLAPKSCPYYLACQDISAPSSIEDEYLLEPVLAVVERKILKAKADLALAVLHRPSCPPGGASETYSQNLLEMRLEPCLKALGMVCDKSPWAFGVICEVKNVLRLDGFTERRKGCGLYGCNCHLGYLNNLLAEKMSPEVKDLHSEIALATADRHKYAAILSQQHEAWEDAKFSKRIAEEMVDEHKWDGSGELKELDTNFQKKAGAQATAEAAYWAAHTVAQEAAGKYHMLVEQMKILNQ